MTALFCNLDALTKEERIRHSELFRQLFAAAEVREEANGYALRIPPASMSLAEVGEWMELERRCCPFIDFSIEVRLYGDGDVKQFIAAELMR